MLNANKQTGLIIQRSSQRWLQTLNYNPGTCNYWTDQLANRKYTGFLALPCKHCRPSVQNLTQNQNQKPGFVARSKQRRGSRDSWVPGGNRHLVPFMVLLCSFDSCSFGPSPSARPCKLSAGIIELEAPSVVWSSSPC